MFRWSRAAQLDAFFNLPFDPLPDSDKVHQTALQALKEMKDYIIDLVKQRMQQLQADPNLDDIVSRRTKQARSITRVALFPNGSYYSSMWHRPSRAPGPISDRRRAHRVRARSYPGGF
jgi:hypothetical protein